MKKILATVFVLIAVGAFSQELNKEESSLIKEQNLRDQTAIEGTYQIHVINARFKPALNSEHIKLIKDSRKDNEDVTIAITEKLEILVLSRAKVHAGELINNNQQVVYLRR